MRARGGIAALTLILSAAIPGCAEPSSPPVPPSPSPASSPRAAEAGSNADAPVVRDLVLEGVAAFPPPAVYRAIRVRPGARLRRDASAIAADLEARYRDHGYLGARVRGAWDPARGVLTLQADEGRLREVELSGVDGGAAERARALMDLRTGEVVTEKELRAGLRRLEDLSRGAFRLGDPPYVVEPLAEGVRVRLSMATVATRLRVRLQGPDPSPLHTRVEGTAPGAGLELTLFDASSLEHAHLYARAAYGFTAHDARFALGAQRPFAAHRLVLGYEFHDLTDTDDVFRRYAVETPPGVPRLFSIVDDYYRRRGHEAYAFVRPHPRLHLGASWRRDDFRTMPVVADDVLFLLKRRPRPNPEVAQGERTSVILSARWAARGALYPSGGAERDSFLVRNPYGDPFSPEQAVRLDATLELAGASADGGSYRRVIGHLRAHRDLSRLFALDGRLLVGASGGDLPPQRLFALGGAGTLRGYGLKRFGGTDAVLGTVEARLRAPARWPDLIAFYDAGTAWTRGTVGPGWRDDVGLGLEWPSGGEARLRIDGAVALRPPRGEDRARVHAAVVLPF